MLDPQRPVPSCMIDLTDTVRAHDPEQKVISQCMDPARAPRAAAVTTAMVYSRYMYGTASRPGARPRAEKRRIRDPTTRTMGIGARHGPPRFVGDYRVREQKRPNKGSGASQPRRLRYQRVTCVLGLHAEARM